MIVYARQEPIPNVKGFLRYLQDRKLKKDGTPLKKPRQENFIFGKSRVLWNPIIAFEDAHARSQNQARGLTIALPNEWISPFKNTANIPQKEIALIEKRIDILIQYIFGKNKEVDYYVHQNKTKNNLHVHIVFNERSKSLPQMFPKRYDRDVYLDFDGKVAKRKADRATDKDGNVKPPIHKKGDCMWAEYTPKDPYFKHPAFIHRCKKILEKNFKKWKTKVEPPNYFPYVHQGKGDTNIIKLRILQNARIAEYNKEHENLLSQGFTFPARKTPEWYSIYDEIVCGEYKRRLKKCKGEWDKLNTSAFVEAPADELQNQISVIAPESVLAEDEDEETEEKLLEETIEENKKLENERKREKAEKYANMSLREKADKDLKFAEFALKKLTAEYEKGGRRDVGLKLSVADRQKAVDEIKARIKAFDELEKQMESVESAENAASIPAFEPVSTSAPKTVTTVPVSHEPAETNITVSTLEPVSTLASNAVISAPVSYPSPNLIVPASIQPDSVVENNSQQNILSAKPDSIEPDLSEAEIKERFDKKYAELIAEKQRYAEDRAVFAREAERTVAAWQSQQSEVDGYTY